MKRVFCADALLFVIRNNGTVIEPICLVPKRDAVFAQEAGNLRNRHAAKISDSYKSERLERRACLLADHRQFFYVQGCQVVFFGALWYHYFTVRLDLVGSYFTDELVCGKRV